MHDSDNYDPLTALNSYSPLPTIGIKDKELIEQTKNITMKIYTQDLIPRHEDTLPFSGLTMSLLRDIYLTQLSEGNQFTSQIILPPSETIDSGFARLSQNALWGIGSGLDITVFGGTDQFSVNNYPENEMKQQYTQFKELKTECYDLKFILEKMIGPRRFVETQVFVFSHFGYNQQYEYMKQIDCAQLKRSLFDNHGKVLSDVKDNVLLDQINAIDDDYRYEYNYVGLCLQIGELIKTGCEYMELRVKFASIDDNQHFKDFCQMCKRNNVEMIVGKNKIVVRNNNKNYRAAVYDDYSDSDSD
jgi:hypothetical protein